MNHLLTLAQTTYLLLAIKIIAIILVGFFLACFLSNRVEKLLQAKLSSQLTMLARKGVYFIVLIIFAMAALQQLNLKLSIIMGAILGAGGVLTLALGFASQTSASNLISGLFLLLEKPFKVGDAITVNSTTGKVKSVDLLSVKLTTFDNRLVRIPNETMIKADIINLTYFKTRRLDIVVGVAYKEKLNEARTLLTQIAAEHDTVLKTPEPAVILLEMADSSVNLRLSAWVKTQDYATLKSELQYKIKRVFDEKNIDIPFPQMTLHLADQENPFKIKQS